jgi:cation transport regulator ChaB
MFERTRTDNIEVQATPVEITLDSGEVLAGRLLILAGRTIVDMLNGQASFLEFEPYEGERIFVSKAALRNVRLLSKRAPDLAGRARDVDGFDPAGILGIPSGASLDDAKAAWHRLSKIYHPDRYASADLPDEVREYLASMARRINTAFAALETAHRARRRAAEQRSTPIFTSAARA